MSACSTTLQYFSRIWASVVRGLDHDQDISSLKTAFQSGKLLYSSASLECASCNFITRCTGSSARVCILVTFSTLASTLNSTAVQVFSTSPVNSTVIRDFQGQSSSAQ